MSRDQNNGFSILKELWVPALFGFILVVLMTGGYFLIGKEQKPSPIMMQKEPAPKDASKNALSFLQHLKSGSKVKAYETVSKAFKESMPYPKFIQFLNDYPILTTYDKFELGSPIQQDQDVLLTAVLRSNGSGLPIHFTLVKEGGEWKILGFVVNQPAGAQDLRDLDAINTLKNVAIKFLALLREGNIDEAYHTLTSEGFQTETSKENFVAFVNERPAFRTQSNWDAADGHIDGTRGYLRMYASSKEGKIPVDFSLHSEKGEWKIEGMYLLAIPPKKESGSSAVVILDGIIGSELAPDGSIKNPAKEFSKTLPIFFSILLDVSGKNVQLEVSLLHVPTDAPGIPVATTIPKEGLTRLSYSFTTPPGGWPFGKYILRVTSGDTTRDFNFRIND